MSQVDDLSPRMPVVKSDGTPSQNLQIEWQKVIRLIRAQQATIADLEARVTALEP